VRCALVLVLVGAVSAAAADPAIKERLTAAEVEAAAEAARARLPPVDKPAAERCAALPLDTERERATAATCFRTAGSLGAAVMIWKLLAADSAKPLQSEAVRQLGPAHEAAGSYADAATWYEDYAKHHAGKTDAAEHLTRAICIWRQLDRATDAARGVKALRGLTKRRVDGARLCATIRPIVVPATTPP
jgi:hypothetical protein